MSGMRNNNYLLIVFDSCRYDSFVAARARGRSQLDHHAMGNSISEVIRCNPAGPAAAGSLFPILQVRR